MILISLENARQTKEFEKRTSLLKTNKIRKLNVTVRKKQINSIQSMIKFCI